MRGSFVPFPLSFRVHTPHRTQSHTLHTTHNGPVSWCRWNGETLTGLTHAFPRHARQHQPMQRLRFFCSRFNDRSWSRRAASPEVRRSCAICVPCFSQAFPLAVVCSRVMFHKSWLAAVIAAVVLTLPSVSAEAPQEAERVSPQFPMSNNYIFDDLHTAAAQCPHKNPREIRAVKECVCNT